MRSVWMLACLAGTLSGCAALQNSGYPSIPQPIDVETFSSDLTGLGSDGRAVLSRGFALVDRNCASFFDSLQRARQVGEFGSAQLAAIATAASAVLAIAGAGAPAIGYTAAGLGLASVSVANIQRFALLTDFPDELQNLVLDAQATFKADIQAQIGTDSDNGVGTADAYSVVVAYARLCTLPSMRFLAREALAGARTSAAPSTTAEQASALRAISLRLGFSSPLTVGQAGALLRFANSGRDDPDGQQVRDLLGDRLQPVFRLPALAPRNPAQYAAGIAALRVLAAGMPTLREASREQRAIAAVASAPSQRGVPSERADAFGGISMPRIRVVR